MTPELIGLIVGIVAAPLGAWLGSKLERRKYEILLAKLRTELEKDSSDVKSGELENVRQANNILMETVVEPLREEIKQLRDEVDRLNQALGQIPVCPHAQSCPITRKLRRQTAAVSPDGGVLPARKDRQQARLPPVDQEDRTADHRACDTV